MKSLKDILEASLLDIDGTLKAGDDILKGAEEELRFIAKELSNPRRWERFSLNCYVWSIHDLKDIGKILGNNADKFEIYLGIVNDTILLRIIFDKFDKSHLDSSERIISNVKFSKDKYMKKNKFGHEDGLNISKIYKDYIAKPFSNIEALEEFLKKNAIKGYFYK